MYTSEKNVQCMQLIIKEKDWIRWECENSSILADLGGEVILNFSAF